MPPCVCSATPAPKTISLRGAAARSWVVTPVCPAIFWLPPCLRAWPPADSDVIDAGIIPTPGIAFLTSVLNVEMGAVISASHNPMPDNGIKFFARGGFKLPDQKEDDIEAVLGQDWDRPTGAGVGRREPRPRPTADQPVPSIIWWPPSLR